MSLDENESKFKKKKTQKILLGKSPVITGREKWTNLETGEEADALTTLFKVQDVNFTKVWITHLLNTLEIIGNKKGKVVNYILDKLNYSENILVTTQAEIADALKVSRKTVNETITLLEGAEFIKRRTGALMINPDILAQGSTGKRQYLLMKFDSFGESEEELPKRKKKIVGPVSTNQDQPVVETLGNCPSCGKPLHMVPAGERNGRKWDSFVGCTDYPRCKYTTPKGDLK